METIDLDLFAGPGGWDEAARALGMRPLGVELDAAACATRDAAGHLTARADVSAFPVDQIPGRMRGLIASPPCFPAGTPVVTARGVLAIEDVRVGDLVLTHRARWRPVVHTMSRMAPVFADRWLTATADHPFYARGQIRGPFPHRGPRPEFSLGEAQWVAASKLHGCFTSIPATAAPLPIPRIGGRSVETGAGFWYMVGRWLGDGWLRFADGSDGRRSRAEITICCAREESEGLASKLGDTGMRWWRSEQRTVTRFSASHSHLAPWLATNFGRYAHGKTLPGWAFGMAREDRAAILDGHLDADGSGVPGGWRVTTVSQQLAIAIRILATGLGYTTSLGVHGRRAGIIEGRPVNQRPLWYVDIKSDDGRYSRADDLHRWVKQRKPLLFRGHETVYDITVDEDHSFVAHGLVVHNCTTFSAAGKRAGVALTDILGALVRDLLAGHDTRVQRRREMGRVLHGATPTRPTIGKRAHKIAGAVRSAALVAEPARFIYACSPEWVSLEQVPTVLPLWHVYAAELRRMGYSVWTGKLNAADYGVPQTRERAILIASQARRVSRPEPTHYDPRRGMQLWGTPWVSMAEALGWGATVRPSVAVTAGCTSTGGAEPYGHRGRDALEAERDAGDWVMRRQVGASRQEGRRDHELDEPAPAITGGGSSAGSGNGAGLIWTLRTSFGKPSDTPGNGSHEMDPATRPAHVVTSKAKDWRLRSGQSVAGVGRAERTADEPAVAIIGRADLCAWVTERPATTVQGDPRIGRPGHKDRDKGEAQFAVDSVRITVREAAILQSFPPDYPWQGTKTAQFTQVGNAWCPLAAIPVLGMAAGIDWQVAAETYAKAVYGTTGEAA